MDSELGMGWDWLEVTRFGLSGEERGAARVILEGELKRGLRPPRLLRLIVRRGERISGYDLAGSSVHRVNEPGRRQPKLQWRAVFELPPAIVDDPHAVFELSHPAQNPLVLGAPSPAAIWLKADEELAVLRRPRLGAAALASIAAVVAGFAGLPSTAVAKDYTGSPTPTPIGTISTTTIPSEPPTTTTSVPTTTTSTTANPTTTTTVTETTSPPPATSTTPTTTTTPGQTPTLAPVTPVATTTTTTTTTTKTSSTTSGAMITTGVAETSIGVAGGSGSGRAHNKRHRRRHHHHHRHLTQTSHACPAPTGGNATRHDPGSVASTHCGAGRRTRTHGHFHGPAHPNGGAGLAARKNKRVKAPVHTPAVAPAVNTTASAWQSPIMANPFTSAQLRQYAALVGSLTQPPKYLVRIYKAAARRYHIPWQVLAAINYVETGYGRDLAVSSAGAVGWMQFMPGTWATYGLSVTPNGKPAGGSPNPWQPSDAIFAAARYLVAAGARRNLAKAVYAYNHAGWYVQEVLSIAEQITRHGLKAGSKAERKINAMRTMARLLNGLPYIWGGGHSNFTMVLPGYDCSGFVSAVLHAGGYLTTPVTTQSLPGQAGIMSGPGRWVTIFDRTDGGGLSSDHVIIDIDGQWWEEGGYGADSGRVHRIRHISSAYLQTFNLVLHPHGL